MEIAIENLGGLKRKLTITVPNKKVESSYQNTYQKIKNKVRVPGFRPGRFPKKLVEKKFQDYMQKEALETLIPKYYEEALTSQELLPATQPKFDVLEIKYGEPFIFTAKFELVPEFEIPSFDTFSIQKKEIEFSESEKEDLKSELLLQHSTFVEKETIEDDDIIIMDLFTKKDEMELVTKKDFEYHLGSLAYSPKLDEQLLGLKKNQTKEFSIIFDEDQLTDMEYYSGLEGQEIDFSVFIKNIKTRKLPELNEDFFKKIDPEITTEEKFNHFIESKVLEHKKFKLQENYRKQIFEKIKNYYDFKIPSELLEQSLHEELEIINEKNASEEEKLPSKEELIKQIEDNYRISFFLQKVQQQEQIKMDDQKVQNNFLNLCYLFKKEPQTFAKTEIGRDMLKKTIKDNMEEEVLNFIIEKALIS